METPVRLMLVYRPAAVTIPQRIATTLTNVPLMAVILVQGASTISFFAMTEMCAHLMAAILLQDVCLTLLIAMTLTLVQMMRVWEEAVRTWTKTAMTIIPVRWMDALTDFALMHLYPVMTATPAPQMHATFPMEIAFSLR